MFRFLGKHRASRRARSNSRTTATQSRRRRCGWEQLEDRAVLAISVVSSYDINDPLGLGNSDSFEPSLSADGRYVVFTSYASNLVAGDTNGSPDIFLKDTLSGVLKRLSTDSTDAQGNSDSLEPSISADGRYVVFASYASNLVPGDTNATVDIFLKDTLSGALTRISTAGNGDEANSSSFEPSLSADGRYAVFSSYASNLVPGDSNAAIDIFLKDTVSGVVTRVSTDGNDVQGDDYSYDPSLSADGRYVVFTSAASDLVSGDTNGTEDIFLKDTVSGVTTRLSTDSTEVQGNSDSDSAAFSADARYVVFRSYATNLVSGDTNGSTDIFLKDTVTGELTRLSTAGNGVQGNGSSYEPSISADGLIYVFRSDASNLVPGDTNDSFDIFRVDPSIPSTFPPTVTSPTATNIALTTATLGGTVTADGGAAITGRGIVYSITNLNGNPQIGGVAVMQATAPGTTGTFTINVSALPSGTQISYAAYAQNAAGISYSAVGTFTTQPMIGQLSGITVQILGGVMTVTGTEQDDIIKVEASGSGFIVTANKLINGLPSPQTFPTANSFVGNTLAGHDDLWLAAPLTFDSVTVDLAAGNDRVILGADPNNPINNNVSHPQFGTLGYLTINGPLQVTGGEGDDRVIERSTSVADFKTINLGEGNNEYNVYWSLSQETNFTSGSGQDNVYIGYLSSYEASQFNTGAGNDLISYYASRFYKTANLNSGAGYDTVALDVNIYDQAAIVDTGSEADYLLFSRSIAYMTVSLTTGGGADTVLIGKYISSLDSSGGAVYSNGGSNVDQFTLNTNDSVDTVQIAANVMRIFFANLGEANDDATVEYNLFTDGLLDGGPQGTRLRLNGNANLRTQNAG